MSPCRASPAQAMPALPCGPYFPTSRGPATKHNQNNDEGMWGAWAFCECAGDSMERLHPPTSTAVADTTIKWQGEYSHPQFGGDLRGSSEVVLPARQHVCGCVRQASLAPS